MDLRLLPRTETISGFPFVATKEEIAAMDIFVGPTRPMLPGKRGGRRAMVRDCVIPFRYQIWFFDVLVSSVSTSTHGLMLELVHSEGPIALYRFPAQVNDVLSEFTPARPEFVMEEVTLIAKRMLEHPEVLEHYKEGGVSTAVLMVRGEALKASPRSTGKEIYYWCYRTADAGKLRMLES